jgi:hypothetical protein
MTRSPNKIRLAPAAGAAHAAAMMRFLTILAALTLPAATLAAEGPDDGFVPMRQDLLPEAFVNSLSLMCCTFFGLAMPEFWATFWATATTLIL